MRQWPFATTLLLVMEDHNVTAMHTATVATKSFSTGLRAVPRGVEPFP